MIPHDLRALLAACKEAPDDDAPRHVLADWLEEHGDADRAEFVRVSVRLEAGEVPLGEDAVSRARLHELYSRNADRWLGGLRECLGDVVFRRGLLEARSYLEQLRPLDTLAPPDALPWLETLLLGYGRQHAVGELLDGDALAHFTRLGLTDCKLSAAWLKRLADSPRAAHLRCLRLTTSGSPKPAGEALAAATQLNGLRALELPHGLGDAGLVALADAPWLGGLTTLAMSYGDMRKAALALADSPHAPRLARLILDTVMATTAGLRALAISPVFDELAELRLHRSSLSAGDTEALAARGRWPRLRHLSLSPAPLTLETARRLRALHLPALRRLVLSRCDLDPPALRELLLADWVRGLEWLDLGTNPFGSDGAEALAAAPLEGLRHLNVSHCSIGPDGVRALADSPRLARLRTLILDGNPLGESGLAALGGGAGLPALDALSLCMLKMGTASLRLLAGSDLAARLRHLDLGHNQLGGSDLAALAGPRLAGLTDLRLAYNPVGKTGAALLGGAAFAGLVRLDLKMCRLGDAGVRALLGRDALPALVFLDVDNNDLTRAADAAFLDWPGLPHLAKLGAPYYANNDPLVRQALLGSPAFPHT